MPEPSTGTLLQTLSARFELRGQLGTGSMGVVHRAFDLKLGREVALKTLRADSPELFYNLKEEFRAAASVLHPNLVELYELFVHGSECFFTMELLDAVPFDRWVRQGPVGQAVFDSSRPGPSSDPPHGWTESSTRPIEEVPQSGRFPESTRLEHADAAARLASGAAQLVRAVAALHDAGRIHCDLKPSNILVTPSGRLVVLDFGLSSPRTGQLARAGFSGTLAYAAPEQMWGGELTPATDWYSVGVVLFQALTGDLPEGDAQLGQTMASAWAALELESKSQLPAELASLLARLLKLDPSQRPTRDAINAVLDPPQAPRSVFPVEDQHFVGRDAELATLQRAFHAARAGWVTALTIHGDSGMGKTELVREFSLQAARDSALVLRGQCRLDESVPYQALDRVIDELYKHLSLLDKHDRRSFLPDDFASLVRVFPVLGRLGRSEPLPDDIDSSVLRQRALVAMRQLLWRLCAWRPLVVWVDDAHWGDVESQSLLCELLREPAPPLLLLFSHRDANVPWLRPIRESIVQAQGQWLSLETGPLDADASTELASSLLGELGREQPMLAERVARESNNIPLFIAQLCRLIAETPRGAGGTELPLTLIQVIERRVQALAEDEQRVTEMVALMDAPMPVEVVAEAAGLSSEMSRIVSRLASARLLRVTGGRPDPRLTSYHQHVRETILARLDPAARTRGHRLLASAIEQLTPSVVPEVLLRHWLGAGEPVRAREVALQAARAASEKLAFGHAAALYRTALELSAPGSSEHDTTQALLARALSSAGRVVEAGEQYRQLARRAQEPESLRLMQLAAENFLVGGVLDQGMAVLSEALARVGLPLPGSSSKALLRGMLRMLGFRLASRRRTQAEPTPLDPGLVLRTDLCLSAAKGLGAVEPMLGAYFTFSALNIAARAGDPLRAATALCLAGMMLGGADGRLRRWGSEWLDEAMRIADASGDMLLRGRVLVCQAQAEVLLGRWASVLQHCDAATKWLEVHPDAATWERNMAHMAALRALEEVGQLRRAWQRAADWQKDARSRGDLYAQTTADLYLSFAKLAEGKPDQAEQLATLALTRWTVSPPPFQEFYRLRVSAYTELYRDRAGLALGIAERAEQTLRDAQLDRFPMAVLEVSLLRARILLRLARSGTGKERSLARVRQDAARLDKLKRSDASAHAALLRAAVEALSGNTDLARDQLGLARAKFAERQMAPGLIYVAYAEATLGKTERDSAQRRAQEISLRQLGIADPRSWLGLHAPGFE